MLGVPLRAAVPSGWRVLQVRSLLPPGPPPWAQLCCRGIRALLWVGRPERPGLHVEMRDFPLRPSGDPMGSAPVLSDIWAVLRPRVSMPTRTRVPQSAPSGVPLM